MTAEDGPSPDGSTAGDAPESGRATRRDVAKLGGALLASGPLAGCISGSDPNANGAGSDDGAAGSDGDAGNGSTTSDDPGESADSSYSVSMAPVGDVTFDSVPDRWIAYCNAYMDMGVALGVEDGLVGAGGDDRVFDYVYEELPGVDFDASEIEAFEVRTKEEFYELGADVHCYDPQMLIEWFDWDEADVEAVRENVGPFFGNLIFRRSDDWHDYEYYTLYEAFEKVATLFQRRERFEAFQSLHDEYVSRLQDQLPPESERPEVFLTYAAADDLETFSPYRLDDRGVSKKQWNDLGAKDVLADTDVHQLSSSDRGELDYENLLELDPDVILVRGNEEMSAAEFRDTVLGYVEDHPVGSELTAVQNGQVYRGGYLHQGPIHNLFLTERAAKQLYPDVFGEVTGDDELFDRQAVADIVNGEVEGRPTEATTGARTLSRSLPREERPRGRRSADATPATRSNGP